MVTCGALILLCLCPGWCGALILLHLCPGWCGVFILLHLCPRWCGSLILLHFHHVWCGALILLHLCPGWCGAFIFLHLCPVWCTYLAALMFETHVITAFTSTRPHNSIQCACMARKSGDEGHYSVLQQVRFFLIFILLWQAKTAFMMSVCIYILGSFCSSSHVSPEFLRGIDQNTKEMKCRFEFFAQNFSFIFAVTRNSVVFLETTPPLLCVVSPTLFFFCKLVERSSVVDGFVWEKKKSFPDWPRSHWPGKHDRHCLQKQPSVPAGFLICGWWVLHFSHRCCVHSQTFVWLSYIFPHMSLRIQERQVFGQLYRRLRFPAGHHTLCVFSFLFHQWCSSDLLSVLNLVQMGSAEPNLFSFQVLIEWISAVFILSKRKLWFQRESCYVFAQNDRQVEQHQRV